MPASARATASSGSRAAGSSAGLTVVRAARSGRLRALRGVAAVAASASVGQAGRLSSAAKLRGVGNCLCCPELTEILWNHLVLYGYGPDGRLLVGEQGGLVSKVTYTKVFRAAREATFSEEVLRGPLAARAYDFRHACVSTWLFADVEPALVALWAGQSIKVLMDVYASCLDGGEEAAKRKIEKAPGSRRLRPVRALHAAGRRSPYLVVVRGA